MNLIDLIKNKNLKEANTLLHETLSQIVETKLLEVKKMIAGRDELKALSKSGKHKNFGWSKERITKHVTNLDNEINKRTEQSKKRLAKKKNK